MIGAFGALSLFIKIRDELGGTMASGGGDPNYKKIGFSEDQKYKFSAPKAPKILEKFPPKSTKNCQFFIKTAIFSKFSAPSASKICTFDPHKTRFFCS